MDPRPAPPVTIEGGPGWQLDAAQEALGTDREPPPAGSWSDRHRLVSLLLAGAVGFAAASALASVRLTTIAESDQGVLSLDVRSEAVDHGGALVTTADGRPAVTATAVIRNTGPRPVALQRVELVGTPYRSDDLDGRRIEVGGQAAVVLLRPVDCSDLRRSRAPGPLRVRATTGAGTRSVDLRMTTEMLPFHDVQVRGLCGQAEPEAALVVAERSSVVTGSTLVVAAELSNASGRPLSVRALRTIEGLRVARVVDERDAPIGFPLTLEPGDYDPPVEPFEGRGRPRQVVVVLEVDDCARLASSGRDELSVTLVQADVAGDGGVVRATSGWGGDPVLGARLRQAACPDTPRALGDPAQLSEQAMHALRRDHPFLTPD